MRSRIRRDSPSRGSYSRASRRRVATNPETTVDVRPSSIDREARPSGKEARRRQPASQSRWVPCKAEDAGPDAAVSEKRRFGNGLAWAIACWFFLLVWFNDVGNLFSIRLLVSLRPDRLFLPIVFVMYALRRRNNPARIRTHPVEWCMLSLLVWGFLSLLIFGGIHHPENRHLSTLISLVGLPLFIFWCTRRSGFSRNEIGVIFGALVAMAGYLALTALFEHYEIRPLVFPRYILDPSIGIHSDRARGPFGNAAVMGGVLAVLFLTTLFYANNVRRAWPLGLLLGAIGIGIYFTYTRSAWASFAVSCLTLAVFQKRLRRQVLVASLAAALILVSGVASKFSIGEGTLFSKRQSTVEDRANIMRASLAMIKERPFLGFGYGSFQASNYKYFDNAGLISAEEGNHNAFSGLMVELGLLGLLPYLATWLFLLRDSWRLARDSRMSNPFSADVGALAFAVLAGYIAGAQFFDPRFFAFLNCLVFFLAALACTPRAQSAASTCE